MPTPRTQPALYRAATAAVFALAALSLVALGVRLGTSGIMASAERAPAGSTARARATFVDIDRPSAVVVQEEIDRLVDQLAGTLPPSDREAVADAERRAADAAEVAPATVTPRDKPLAPELLPALDQALPLPATTSPVAPVVQPLVSPVLDFLAGEVVDPGQQPQPANPLGLLESLLGGLLPLSAR
ncbi:MAG TPA: hypothetical protein VFO65_05270 [Acidimicrobiales bacterium]|nr:hypothetical protein [Acidimicrobiales bacterium]